MDALFASLLLGAAFFLVGITVARVLGQAFEQYRAVYSAVSNEHLLDGLLMLDGHQRKLLCIACALLGLTGGYVLSGMGMALLVGGALGSTPELLVRRLGSRNLESFNRQLVDALQAMVGSLQAGLSLPQAMEQAALDAPRPLGPEFRLCVRHMKVGIPLGEALGRLGARVPSRELALFASSAALAQQLGGNLSEILETVGATLRERFRIEGRIAALTSQGRLQGWIIALLPVGFGLIFNRMRPDLVQPMFESFFGYALVGLIAAMEVAGVYLMRKIVDVEV